MNFLYVLHVINLYNTIFLVYIYVEYKQNWIHVHMGVEYCYVKYVFSGYIYLKLSCQSITYFKV